MKRSIAKWIISLSEDSRRPLPGWVQRLIENDPTVKRFQQSTVDLSQQLAHDRQEWLDTLPPALSDSASQIRQLENSHAAASKAALAHQERPGKLVPRLIYALAACLLLACGWSMLPALQSNPELSFDPAETADSGREIESMDLRALLATASAGEQIYQQVAAGTAEWLSQHGNASELLFLDESLQEARRAKSSLVETTQDLGSELKSLAMRMGEVSLGIDKEGN